MIQLSFSLLAMARAWCCCWRWHVSSLGVCIGGRFEGFGVGLGVVGLGVGVVGIGSGIGVGVGVGVGVVDVVCWCVVLLLSFLVHDTDECFEWHSC